METELHTKNMVTSHSFHNRSHHLSQIKSQGHMNREDLHKLWLPTVNREPQCPVCLQTASYPVETNCGHIFCAPCLISYWKHGSWLDAINCPLCRQKVNKMCHLFGDNRADRKEREILRQIKDYNKRNSGAPWQNTKEDIFKNVGNSTTTEPIHFYCMDTRHMQVKDYLCDAPLFMLLLVRWLGNMSGLVWLFILRVAVCGFWAAMSLASPLETIPGPLGAVLGMLDDFVVVFLILICIVNINQQMGPQRTRSQTLTHGVLTDAL